MSIRTTLSPLFVVAIGGVAGFTIFLGTGEAHAQCPGGWLPGDGFPGTDGAVYAMTMWDGDGDGPGSPLLIAGGSFSVAGTVSAHNIAAWDGETWHPLGDGVNGPIYSLTVHRGELIVGGQFALAGSVRANNIARWDGASWQPLGDGTNWSVLALAVYGGELIAAGYFTTAGNVSASHIASWNGLSWNPLGSGIEPIAMMGFVTFVSGLTEYNGELIASGQFLTAGGISVSNIARWDGLSWSPLGSGTDGIAGALTVHDGRLIAAGFFGAAGGVSAHGIASWDGSSWSPLGSGLSGWPPPSGGPAGGLGWPPTWGGTVVSALTSHRGALIVGGRFTTAGSVDAFCIAHWDGSSWNPLGGGSISGGIFALAAFGDELIAAGSTVTRWNGSSWSGLTSGMNGQVNALTVHDGHLIASGEFNVAGGIGASGIARWDGFSWHPLGNGFFGTTLASYRGEIIAGHPLYVVADDSNDGGRPLIFDAMAFIARWDGLTWNSLGSGVQGGGVEALIVHKGDLIVGGSFGTAGGGRANSIARWDGTAWHPLGSGIYGYVKALTVHNDELIAGGYFTSAGGVTVNHIARWDGSSWHPLDSGFQAGFFAAVYALSVYNGELIAGGNFTTAGGVSAACIAAWDGSSWHPLDSGMNSNVLALTVYNGDLIAGGWFTTAGGVDANRIARWNGSAWSPLGAGTNGEVAALVVHNGELIVGGSFTVVDGQVSTYWARWGPACAAADLDRDGDVGGSDLALLLSAWGDCPPSALGRGVEGEGCPADLDADGDVDGFDLALLLGAWG